MPIYIPTKCLGVPFSLHPRQHLSVIVFVLAILLLFYTIHPNRCEVISNCGFDFHFLDDL